MRVLSWCPWPWRMNKKSSEPDRTVGGRTEQPLSSRGKCLVVKKKKKKKKKEKGNESFL